MVKERKPRPNVWKNEHCKKYDPTNELGSPDQWVGSFRRRMGLDEAKRIIKDDDPFIIMGLQPGFSQTALKSAYRALVMKWHPDRHQGESAKIEAHQQFIRVQAAYVVLKNRM